VAVLPVPVLGDRRRQLRRAIRNLLLFVRDRCRLVVETAAATAADCALFFVTFLSGDVCAKKTKQKISLKRSPVNSNLTLTGVSLARSVDKRGLRLFEVSTMVLATYEAPEDDPRSDLFQCIPLLARHRKEREKKVLRTTPVRYPWILP
jgi:hypothetical protein